MCTSHFENTFSLAIITYVCVLIDLLETSYCLQLLDLLHVDLGV